MIRIAATSLLGLAALIGVSTVPAKAERTITCESWDNDYRECRAHFRQPVIVRQKSKRGCSRGRTWGYDRDSGRIWVDRGCRAVFAEGARWQRRDDGYYDYRRRERRDDDYWRRERRDGDCFYNGDC